MGELWEKCNVYTVFMGNCWEYHEKYDGKWQFHGSFQSESHGNEMVSFIMICCFHGKMVLVK